MACYCFHWPVAVIMLSSDSGEEWASLPPASSLTTRGTCRSSNDLRGRGSSSSGGAALGASRRVAKHSSRHGPCLSDEVNTPSCRLPAATHASVPPSQWNVVLDTLAELRDEIAQLKVNRQAPFPPSWLLEVTAASSPSMASNG